MKATAVAGLLEGRHICWDDRELEHKAADGTYIPSVVGRLSSSSVVIVGRRCCRIEARFLHADVGCNQQLGSASFNRHTKTGLM